MATTPEGKVKDKAKQLFKLHGAMYDRTVMNGMGHNGRADDVVCRADGHFGGVEYKAGNVRRVTVLQRTWLNRVASCNGSSLVINRDNLGLLEKWLLKPGWRINALFGETERSQNTCIGHVARCPGYAEVFIPFEKGSAPRRPNQTKTVSHASTQGKPELGPQAARTRPGATQHPQIPAG